MMAQDTELGSPGDAAASLFSAETESAAPAPHGGPRAADEEEAWLRLAFVGLPAGRCHAILRQWREPGAVLEAARAGHEAALLATPGITPTTIERLREAAARDLTAARAAIARHRIRLLLMDDHEYPVALRSISDPPPYLFVRGTVEACDEVAVAIVGTRHATEYGRGVAEKIAGDLARQGITVVSGLARGIDTAAHRGALEGGGRTFAVCGCGLDIVYPSDNKRLLEQVMENGAAFSEFAPTVHPESWHFPARNRIISGLSAGVVVVEAGDRSGALITADFALEQDREVFAVPGNIHKPQSRGAHALIKQGATLVESAEDVLAALNNRTLPFVSEQDAAAGTIGAGTAAAGTMGRAGRRPGAGPPPGPEQRVTPPPAVRADLTATENRLYLALEVEPRHVDDLAALTEMGAAEANATLVMLELKGIAHRLPGGMFARAT